MSTRRAHVSSRGAREELSVQDPVRSSSATRFVTSPTASALGNRSLHKSHRHREHRSHRATVRLSRTGAGLPSARTVCFQMDQESKPSAPQQLT
ncbi:unnamed protein product [Gadus morhua 'NCC']